MKKICIYVPTRNNPSLIDYFLKEVQKDVIKYDVDIHIYDTSDTLATKEVVDKYNQLSICYFNKDGYPDKTSDLKIIEGFEKLINQYEYIWLCGDGYVPFIDYTFSIIGKELESGVDVIHFIEKKHINNKSQCYMNSVEHFSRYGWHATLYGATIVATSLFKNTNWREYDYLRNTGFLYWSVLYFALSHKEGKILVLDSDKTFINNPFKKTNSSFRPGGFAHFWIESWPNVVYNLPEEYNQYKALVCKMFGEKTKIYSIRYLIKLRLSNNLSRSIVKSNKENFKKVTDKSYLLIYLISIIPVGPLQIVKKIYNLLKGKK